MHTTNDSKDPNGHIFRVGNTKLVMSHSEYMQKRKEGKSVPIRRVGATVFIFILSFLFLLFVCVVINLFPIYLTNF